MWIYPPSLYGVNIYLYLSTLSRLKLFGHTIRRGNQDNCETIWSGVCIWITKLFIKGSLIFIADPKILSPLISLILRYIVVSRGWSHGQKLKGGGYWFYCCMYSALYFSVIFCPSLIVCLPLCSPREIVTHGLQRGRTIRSKHLLMYRFNYPIGNERVPREIC